MVSLDEFLSTTTFILKYFSNPPYPTGIWFFTSNIGIVTRSYKVERSLNRIWRQLILFSSCQTTSEIFQTLSFFSAPMNPLHSQQSGRWSWSASPSGLCATSWGGRGTGPCPSWPRPSGTLTRSRRTGTKSQRTTKSWGASWKLLPARAAIKQNTKQNSRQVGLCFLFWDFDDGCRTKNRSAT